MPRDTGDAFNRQRRLNTDRVSRAGTTGAGGGNEDGQKPQQMRSFVEPSASKTAISAASTGARRVDRAPEQVPAVLPLVSGQSNRPDGARLPVI